MKSIEEAKKNPKANEPIVPATVKVTHVKTVHVDDIEDYKRE